MSTNTDVLRPLNRSPATVRGRAISMKTDSESKTGSTSKTGFTSKSGWLSRPGSLTQSFFARGEEQEANEYENLPIDDPTLAPPPLEFDSFDKIPRRRGSWFAIAVSTLVLAAVGIVTWRSFRYLSRPSTSVAAASRAMVQAPPAAPEAVNQSMQAMQPDPTVQSLPAAPSKPAAQSAPASQSAPVAPPAQSAQMTQSAPVAPPAPAKAAPVAKPARVAAPAPIVVPLVSKPAPDTKHEAVVREPAKSETDDEPAQVRKHPPLHGYVWSPEKHTLVPAEPVIEDLPREAPRSQSLEGAPAQEPQPAAEPTSPDPFPSPPLPSSPSPSTNQAPIIE
jgi:hypothetical protein